MQLKKTHIFMGFGWEWDHISERYDAACMNSRNTISVFDNGVTALITSRGNVLASIGMDIAPLEYLIKEGYIA